MRRVAQMEITPLEGDNVFSGGPHGSNVIHILERSYVIESATGTPGMTPNIP
jgi:hypothetical protein